MYLFCVKDVKSGIFAAPFVSENSETAARALQTTLFTSTDSLLKLYPEDYILYQVGTFDNETGWIEHTENIRVACCSELIDNLRKTDDDSNAKVTRINRKKSK